MIKTREMSEITQICQCILTRKKLPNVEIISALSKLLLKIDGITLLNCYDLIFSSIRFMVLKMLIKIKNLDAKSSHLLEESLKFTRLFIEKVFNSTDLNLKSNIKVFVKFQQFHKQVFEYIVLIISSQHLKEKSSEINLLSILNVYLTILKNGSCKKNVNLENDDWDNDDSVEAYGTVVKKKKNGDCNISIYTPLKPGEQETTTLTRIGTFISFLLYQINHNSSKIRSISIIALNCFLFESGKPHAMNLCNKCIILCKESMAYFLPGIIKSIYSTFCTFYSFSDKTVIDSLQLLGYLFTFLLYQNVAITYDTVSSNSFRCQLNSDWFKSVLPKLFIYMEKILKMRHDASKATKMSILVLLLKFVHCSSVEKVMNQSILDSLLYYYTELSSDKFSKYCKLLIFNIFVYKFAKNSAAFLDSFHYKLTSNIDQLNENFDKLKEMKNDIKDVGNNYKLTEIYAVISILNQFNSKSILWDHKKILQINCSNFSKFSLFLINQSVNIKLIEPPFTENDNTVNDLLSTKIMYSLIEYITLKIEIQQIYSTVNVFSKIQYKYISQDNQNKELDYIKLLMWTLVNLNPYKCLEYLLCTFKDLPTFQITIWNHKHLPIESSFGSDQFNFNKEQTSTGKMRINPKLASKLKKKGTLLSPNKSYQSKSKSGINSNSNAKHVNDLLDSSNETFQFKNISLENIENFSSSDSVFMEKKNLTSDSVHKKSLSNSVDSKNDDILNLNDININKLSTIETLENDVFFGKKEKNHEMDFSSSHEIKETETNLKDNLISPSKKMGIKTHFALKLKHNQTQSSNVDCNDIVKTSTIYETHKSESDVETETFNQYIVTNFKASHNVNESTTKKANIDNSNEILFSNNLFQLLKIKNEIDNKEEEKSNYTENNAKSCNLNSKHEFEYEKKFTKSEKPRIKKKFINILKKFNKNSAAITNFKPIQSMDSEQTKFQNIVSKTNESNLSNENIDEIINDFKSSSVSDKVELEESLHSKRGLEIGYDEIFSENSNDDEQCKQSQTESNKNEGKKCYDDEMDFKMSSISMCISEKEKFEQSSFSKEKIAIENPVESLSKNLKDDEILVQIQTESNENEREKCDDDEMNFKMSSNSTSNFGNDNFKECSFSPDISDGDDNESFKSCVNFETNPDDCNNFPELNEEILMKHNEQLPEDTQCVENSIYDILDPNTSTNMSKIKSLSRIGCKLSTLETIPECESSFEDDEHNSVHRSRLSSVWSNYSDNLSMTSTVVPQSNNVEEDETSIHYTDSNLMLNMEDQTMEVQEDFPQVKSLVPESINFDTISDNTVKVEEKCNQENIEKDTTLEKKPIKPQRKLAKKVNSSKSILRDSYIEPTHVYESNYTDNLNMGNDFSNTLDLSVDESNVSDSPNIKKTFSSKLKSKFGFKKKGKNKKSPVNSLPRQFVKLDLESDSIDSFNNYNFNSVGTVKCKDPKNNINLKMKNKLKSKVSKNDEPKNPSGTKNLIKRSKKSVSSEILFSENGQTPKMCQDFKEKVNFTVKLKSKLKNFGTANSLKSFIDLYQDTSKIKKTNMSTQKDDYVKSSLSDIKSSRESIYNMKCTISNSSSESDDSIKLSNSFHGENESEKKRQVNNLSDSLSTLDVNNNLANEEDGFDKEVKPITLASRTCKRKSCSVLQPAYKQVNKASYDYPINLAQRQSKIMDSFGMSSHSHSKSKSSFLSDSNSMSSKDLKKLNYGSEKFYEPKTESKLENVTNKADLVISNKIFNGTECINTKRPQIFEKVNITPYSEFEPKHNVSSVYENSIYQLSPSPELIKVLEETDSDVEVISKDSLDSEINNIQNSPILENVEKKKKSENVNFYDFEDVSSGDYENKESLNTKNSNISNLISECKNIDKISNKIPEIVVKDPKNALQKKKELLLKKQSDSIKIRKVKSEYAKHTNNLLFVIMFLEIHEEKVQSKQMQKDLNLIDQCSPCLNQIMNDLVEYFNENYLNSSPTSKTENFVSIFECMFVRFVTNIYKFYSKNGENWKVLKKFLCILLYHSMSCIDIVRINSIVALKIISNWDLGGFVKMISDNMDFIVSYTEKSIYMSNNSQVAITIITSCIQFLSNENFENSDVSKCLNLIEPIMDNLFNLESSFTHTEQHSTLLRSLSFSIKKRLYFCYNVDFNDGQYLKHVNNNITKENLFEDFETMIKKEIEANTKPDKKLVTIEENSVEIKMGKICLDHILRKCFTNLNSNKLKDYRNTFQTVAILLQIIYLTDSEFLQYVDKVWHVLISLITNCLKKDNIFEKIKNICSMDQKSEYFNEMSSSSVIMQQDLMNVVTVLLELANEFVKRRVLLELLPLLIEHLTNLGPESLLYKPTDLDEFKNSIAYFDQNLYSHMQNYSKLKNIETNFQSTYIFKCQNCYLTVIDLIFSKCKIYSLKHLMPLVNSLHIYLNISQSLKLRQIVTQIFIKLSVVSEYACFVQGFFSQIESKSTNLENYSYSHAIVKHYITKLQNK
ncbi:hypothetical protein A3Q56_01570 [Intoshia linei]|uniref:Uncharacterized protein n=1 Tax=Intoshia linei TaxID=1819745 RepID=A0A177B8T7_9BILA|nr:hypothetical protein A3Q56_01570 [Intoshia linei]